jgi:hypothetical protein
MKIPDFSTSLMTALLLLGAGAILIGIALITDRGGITSAAVVISGAICFFCGIFFLTFAGRETFDPVTVSLLPVQGSINLCRITADLGIHGNAWFLPEPFHSGTGVMQLIPVSQYDGKQEVTGDSFLITGCGGVLVPPACTPVLADLRARCNLTVPADPAGLDALFGELGTEVLGCAESVSVIREGNLVTVTLSGYLFTLGCRKIFGESPRCCITSPCPICSLFGVLLAESGKTPVEVRRCEPVEKGDEVTAVFSYAA